VVTRNHWVRLYSIALKGLGWAIFIGAVLTGFVAGVHGYTAAPDRLSGLWTFTVRLVTGTATGSAGSATMFLVAYAFDLGLQIEENTRRTMIAVDRLTKLMEREEG
jgi:hypothetical protein